LVEIEEMFDAAQCTGSVHAVRLSTGAEVGHDADRAQVLASVVKVPIGLEFYAQIEEAQLDPIAQVTLTPDRATPGPVGISQFSNPVRMSIRDLCYLMLTISDNAATDVVSAAVGIDGVNRRLRAIGCDHTAVVESLESMLNGVATDLGYARYSELLAAQDGQLGPEARASSTDPERIDHCRALDPAQTSHSTARDATRLLAAVWRDTAASAAACTMLRTTMAQQVTRRLAPAVREGGILAAKSGALFGRVRNEIAVITDSDGESYAVAVFTRANRPFTGASRINAAMADAARWALDELRD
jgi:beta-lactamase class A